MKTGVSAMLGHDGAMMYDMAFVLRPDFVMFTI